MSSKYLKEIKSIKTDNEDLNEFLLYYEEKGNNEKLNFLAKLSQYYIVEKGYSKEQYTSLVNPIFEDIKLMSIKSRHVRKLYNNYDVYMYLVHNLNYGYYRYKNNLFNLDDSNNRYNLINLLIEDGIIEVINNDDHIFYRFVNIKIIKQLKEYFIWEDKDNDKLNDRAIILNLRGIGTYLKNSDIKSFNQ